MFEINQLVVYPGHGVARINRILSQTIGGQKAELYELKFINKDMTILIPVNNVVAIGVRPLSSHTKIDKIFEFLATPARRISNQELNTTNWSKRNKEYQSKIRTGSLEEISQIYRDLKCIEAHKELSFGEKNLLHQTEAMLAEEIAIVKEFGEEKALEHLRSIFNNIAIATNRVSQPHV